MESTAATPAATAETGPETDFQALTRAAGVRLSATVPVETPLTPIVEQVTALLAEIPDDDRQHDTWDRSWSSIWLAYPPGPRDPATGQPTRWFSRVPGLAVLADEFGGAMGVATIARISPGDLLDWHYDPVSPDDDWVRLHLPVVTHPRAVTDLSHERVHWPAGTLNFGDYGFPHRVLNTSETERIHLYFDVPAAAVCERLPPDFSGDGARARAALRQEAVRLMLAARSSAAVSAAG